MSSSGNLFSSSIGKKLIMSLTGTFLITFLLIHLVLNLLTLVSKEAFNEAAHFMATNPIIQLMQFVLAAGFIFHIVYGIILWFKNRAARPIKYAKSTGYGSSWSSRNMIYTGVLVLLFLVLHIKDFFIEVKSGNYGGYDNDYDMVVHLFASPVYTAIYIIAFIGLGLHLYHGFQSAFQSIGLNHPKYTPFIKKLSVAYCLLISIGFSAIALILHFKPLM